MYRTTESGKLSVASVSYRNVNLATSTPEELSTPFDFDDDRPYEALLDDLPFATGDDDLASAGSGAMANEVRIETAKRIRVWDR